MKRKDTYYQAIRTGRLSRHLRAAVDPKIPSLFGREVVVVCQHCDSNWRLAANRLAPVDCKLVIPTSPLLKWGSEIVP